MMNYRREETGRRMSYIFSCAAFAGAVGGLIAGGLVRIETGNMTGWQYLYVVSGTLDDLGFAKQVKVEGAISLILAPIALFWIPNDMRKAWFLKAHERELASIRYEINKRNYNHDEQFSWREVRKAVTDWTVSTDFPLSET
jgi:MFS family permease